MLKDVVVFFMVKIRYMLESEKKFASREHVYMIALNKSILSTELSWNYNT